MVPEIPEVMEDDGNNMEIDIIQSAMVSITMFNPLTKKVYYNRAFTADGFDAEYLARTANSVAERNPIKEH